MIISHKHRFIFLKTNKTAGTSIEIALSRVCGEDDVISPVSPEDEPLRARAGGRGPQNHRAPLTDYRGADWKRLFLKGKPKARFYNHISAAEVKSLVGEPVWSSYYKFCFERNPWDRVVSLYYWLHPKDPRPTLTEFVRTGGADILKRRGFGLYTIDGRLAVDRVCFFEEIDAELAAVGRHLGLEKPFEIPRAKSSSRKDKRHYRDILSEEERELIAERFQPEIEWFGYQF